MRLRGLIGRDRDSSTPTGDTPAEVEADQPVAGTAQPMATRGPLRGLLGGRAARNTAEDRVQWQHGDTIATRVLHAALVGALVSGPRGVVLGDGRWTVGTDRVGDRSGGVGTAGEP